MKLMNIVESVVKRLLACFALIVLCFSVVGDMLGGLNTVWALTVSQIFTFFWFSVLFSISCEIANFIKNNSVIKGAVRFILSLGSFVLIFYTSDSFAIYLSQKQNKAYSIFMITFIYTLIYVISALLGALIKFVKNKVENSSKEYKQVYNK